RLLLGRGLRQLAGRHGHGERRAFAGRRLDLERQAEQVHEPADDRQAEAEAVRALRAAVDLVELLEDSLELVLGNADARVADGERERGAGSVAADANLAPLGVANGVRHEVAEDPAKELRIGVCDAVARLYGEPKALLERLLLEVRAQTREDVVDGERRLLRR